MHGIYISFQSTSTCSGNSNAQTTYVSFCSTNHSSYDHDHSILFVITEFVCCTCIDVSCTIWWNIYYIYYIFYIIYFKQLVHNTKVLIRNNFNNKATSHVFSSHSMVKIATVGTSKGHKWQARDTSDPSDHCRMLYGNSLALSIFAHFIDFSGSGKYTKARPTSTKTVIVKAM